MNKVPSSDGLLEKVFGYQHEAAISFLCRRRSRQGRRFALMPRQAPKSLGRKYAGQHSN